jgi:hypothetical protein
VPFFWYHLFHFHSFLHYWTMRRYLWILKS